MSGMSIGPKEIAAFIGFIGILIFVHELGHFLAAKWFNIKVVKFSLGFGPPLIAFRRGETQYQIAAFPLGGFVKMVGDAPGEEIDPDDRARAFTNAPIHRRAIIALAGPAFNLIFPVVCFFAHNLLGPEVVSPVVGQMEIGKPAELAGMKRGDRVLSVDGARVWSFDRMAELISPRPGEPLTIKVLRDGQELELKVTPAPTQGEDFFGAPETQGKIGVSYARAGTRIGIDDPKKNTGKLITGDRVLRVAGKAVERAEDLNSAIAHAAGQTVELDIARPSPLALGDLMLADAEEPVKISVDIPAGAKDISALGLAQSDTFVRGIAPGGAADRAGLRPGDRVLAVDGKEISLYFTFINLMKEAKQNPVQVLVRRNGEELALSLVNDRVMRKHPVTGLEREELDAGLGIGPVPRTIGSQHWSTTAPDEKEQARLTIPEAFVAAVYETTAVIGMVTTGIFKLFTRQISADNVGGPLMLFEVAARAAEMGTLAYLTMLAWISVNLGLVNLLPIPIFDGGHLLFCAIEAVRRKPLSLRAREAASIVGLVLLFALIVLAMRNDIARMNLF